MIFIMCYVNSRHDAKTAQAYTLYIHVRTCTSCSKSVHTCTSGGRGEKDVNSFVAQTPRFAFYNRKVKIDHE